MKPDTDATREWIEAMSVCGRSDTSFMEVQKGEWVAGEDDFEYIKEMANHIDAQAEEIKRLREALEYYADRDNMAVIQHDIWSSWMRFMFSTGSMTIFNEWTMSPDRVERWKRQMNTTYIGLTPDEKETDCKVIDEFRITDKAQAALKPTEEGHWDCVCTNPTPSSPSVEGKRKCLFCAREMVYRTALKPNTEEGK